MTYKLKLSNFKTTNLLGFNRNLNNFFDIKTLIYLNENKSEIKKKAQYLSKDYKKYINTKPKIGRVVNIKNKKINFNKFNKSKNKKKIVQSLSLLKKHSKFFEYLIIHGSYANQDFINYWSDLDTFTVITDECLMDYKNLLKLRFILKKFYKIVLKYSPMQHHGLILFSKADLANYDNNLLPIEALKFNMSVIYPKKKYLKINLISNNLFSSKKSLLDRLKFINLSLKKGYFDHHVFGSKKLSVPIKLNDKSLKQFITHVNYMLNIPILFLSSINKSVHKKNSFKIFYNIIKNKKIEDFIKKHEYFRKNWYYYNSSNKINEKILSFFGENYFKECKEIIKFTLKKISHYDR